MLTELSFKGCVLAVVSAVARIVPVRLFVVVVVVVIVIGAFAVGLKSIASYERGYEYFPLVVTIGSAYFLCITKVLVSQFRVTFSRRFPPSSRSPKAEDNTINRAQICAVDL